MLTTIGFSAIITNSLVPPSGDKGTMVIVEGSLSGAFLPCDQDKEAVPKKIAMESKRPFHSQFFVKFVIN